MLRTLAELYLGSEPTEVTVSDDQLLVTLADGQVIGIPLPIVSTLAHAQSLPTEAEVLLLRCPPKIDRIRVTESALEVYLRDGRVLSSPLDWFPRLSHGTPAERNHYELIGDNTAVHWPDLDEDIELLGLLRGEKSAESERSIQRWLTSRSVITA